MIACLIALSVNAASDLGQHKLKAGTPDLCSFPQIVTLAAGDGPAPSNTRLVVEVLPTQYGTRKKLGETDNCFLYCPAKQSDRHTGEIQLRRLRGCMG